MLSTVYPEYPWLPWKFAKCPDGYWDDINNQRQYMDWLGQSLGFKELSDWYSIGQKVLFITSQPNFQGFQRNWRKGHGSIKIHGIPFCLSCRRLSRIQLAPLEIRQNIQQILVQS